MSMVPVDTLSRDNVPLRSRSGQYLLILLLRILYKEQSIKDKTKFSSRIFPVPESLVLPESYFQLRI
jgi:hypothetical protein